MAQHKSRSRIAQFKQPFLVGAVTSAALASGCGGESGGTGSAPGRLEGPGDPSLEVTSNPPGWLWTCPEALPEVGTTCPDYLEERECGTDTGPGVRCVGGSWQGVGGEVPQNPPPVSNECPQDEPAVGKACAEYEPDLSCDYDGDSSCLRTLRCDGSEWVDESPTCNPPPPQLTGDCPTQAPNAGADCSTYEPDLNCDYDADFSCSRTLRCDGNEWVDESPTCNPPPPDVTSPEPIIDCPPERPTVGETCDGMAPGLECDYEDALQASCPEASVYTCGTSGTWVAPEVQCNPPPPLPLTECPTEPPVLGDTCEQYEFGLQCGEPTCDGGLGAVCGDTGIWEGVAIACNPPMPLPDAGADSAERDGG